MSKSTDQILTWSQFKELVTELAEGKSTYLYRGQSEDTWKLRTTFHRRAESLDLTLDKYLDQVIPQVHYDVSAALSYTFNLQDELEFGAFLALCQHHGFPTPLLDWTFSPYMAAYFAFRGVKESDHPTDYVKLFLFDHVGWTKTYIQPVDLRHAKPYISVVRPFATLNLRILPQQGAFTVTNVADMETHIRGCERRPQQFLHTVRISVKEKPTVMRDLNLMGINQHTLFPGLDGLFGALADRLLSGEMGETTPDKLRRLTQPQRPPLADLSELLGWDPLGSLSTSPQPAGSGRSTRPK